MSEIKRYAANILSGGTGCCGGPVSGGGMPVMNESENGDYVRYEDLERIKRLLTAERERVKELERLLTLDANTQYKVQLHELEALRQAIREKAREWEAESSHPLPDLCEDEQQRPFIDGRRNACAEHAAELLQLEKNHAG